MVEQQSGALNCGDDTVEGGGLPTPAVRNSAPERPGPGTPAGASSAGRSSSVHVPFSNTGVVSLLKQLHRRTGAKHHKGAHAAQAQPLAEAEAEEDGAEAADVELGGDLFVLTGASTVLNVESPPVRSPRNAVMPRTADTSGVVSLPEQASDAKACISSAEAPPEPQGKDLPAAPRHKRKSFLRETKSVVKQTWAIVRRHPLTWLLPLATFTVAVAFGTWGVVAASSSAATAKRNDAYSAAVDAAVSFAGQLRETYTPGVTLDMMIREEPHWSVWQSRFNSVAEQLMKRVLNNSLYNIQLQPFGQNRIIYPLRPSDSSQLGRDLLADPSRSAAALMVVASGSTGTNGPFYLTPQNFTGAFVRTPIFITDVYPNETFGYTLPGGNSTQPAVAGFPPGFRNNCTSACFKPNDPNEPNGKGTIWWGFVTMTINYDAVIRGSDARLATLADKGYKYALIKQLNATSEQVIAEVGGNVTRANAVNATVNPPQATWMLLVEPYSGWNPSWLAPLIVTVVVLSIIISILLFVALVSYQRQRMLLRTTVASNRLLAITTKELQEEKVRMDALLIRQYELLACFGRGGSNGPSGSPMLGPSASRRGITMERIEDARRMVNVAANNSTETEQQDQITLHELLGEGAFGKVHKGLWRGTVVAIKTMILPANMTGAEKREKMAVMEAAISSSLVHPNIVTTYTYSIKPYREQDDGFKRISGGSGPGSGEGSGQAGTNTAGAQGSLLETGGNNSTIHSYEVRLVLEYCDKRSLKEALDQDAFMTPVGLNVAAVLETLADVAKAMVHMHAANVLHSDLKARNVLLKSTGSEGRGVMAKVADFGLSTQLSQTDTHVSSMFQGTMTHMAPEVMLEGRISKESDVYAFGILMWEAFCAASPFEGVPRAHLGHAITKENRRPKFPPFAPKEYVALAEKCWAPDPVNRLSFRKVLQELQALREQVPGETAAIKILDVVPNLVQSPARHATLAERGGGGGSGAAADGSTATGGVSAGGGLSPLAKMGGGIYIGSMNMSAMGIKVGGNGGSSSVWHSERPSSSCGLQTVHETPQEGL